jgi:hypothetical protein
MHERDRAACYFCFERNLIVFFHLDFRENTILPMSRRLNSIAQHMLL